MSRVGIIGIGHGVFGRRSDATVQELAFDDLDAPVVRLSAIDAPAIYSPKLEKVQLPRPVDVVEKVLLQAQRSFATPT